MKNNANFRIIIISAASILTINSLTVRAADQDSGIQLCSLKKPLLQFDQAAKIQAALSAQESNHPAPAHLSMHDDQRQQLEIDDRCCCERCFESCCALCVSVLFEDLSKS